MRLAKPALTVVGAGYVGLTTAVAASLQGHRVHVVETSPERIKQIRNGHAPFYEPGLEEALARSLRSGRLTIDVPGRTENLATVVMLCVGTPPSATGAPDFAYLRSASEWVGERLRGPTPRIIVVVKSTVVPGTTETVVQQSVAKTAGPRASFEVAANPEFLREGSAMTDAMKPDRVVIGSSSLRSAKAILRLYAKMKCPKIVVDIRTAEAIKYAANAFLALKIGFSNELANYCERAGVDWYVVVKGISPDPRIGGLFLRAGAGFGGSCFPKDVAALRASFQDQNVDSPLLDAVLDGNQRQPLVAVDLLRDEIGDLQGKRIALLGLAFKPDTDDVRETRALPIYRALREAGAIVVCHDPKAGPNFQKLDGSVTLAPSARSALDSADGCIVQTEWAEYRRLTPQVIHGAMRSPVVVDGRRTFEAKKMWRAGIRYRAIGLGRPSMQ